MGMYNCLLNKGVYNIRCEELRQHFAKIMNVSVNVIHVSLKIKQYSYGRITFYEVKMYDKMLITERYSRLIKMTSYHEKRNQHNKVIRNIKIERFNIVKEKFKANGISNVTFDEDSDRGAITYVCDKCGYIGHTNLSSAWIGRCRCKQCWLQGKRK